MRRYEISSSGIYAVPRGRGEQRFKEGTKIRGGNGMVDFGILERLLPIKNKVGWKKRKHSLPQKILKTSFTNSIFNAEV